MIGRASPLKVIHERRTHRRERRGVEPTFDRSDEVFADSALSTPIHRWEVESVLTLGDSLGRSQCAAGRVTTRRVAEAVTTDPGLAMQPEPSCYLR